MYVFLELLDNGSVQTGVVQICYYIVIFPVLGALRFFISFLWSMTLTVLSLMLTTCRKKRRWTDEQTPVQKRKVPNLKAMHNRSSITGIIEDVVASRQQT
jgi:hypothetical protein